MIVFREVMTYQHIGKHLEKLGVKMSKLSALLNSKKKVDDAEFEAENDLLVLTFNENKICVTFVEVKTQEYHKPWVEDKKDQSIEENLMSKAKDQLMRNVLRYKSIFLLQNAHLELHFRFLELFPDVEFLGKLEFKFFAAFPLVSTDPGTRDFPILTEQDLLSRDRLRDKFGLKRSEEKEKNLLVKICSRYLGLHSTLEIKSSKESFKADREELDFGKLKFESAIRTQIEGTEGEENLFLCCFSELC